MNRGCHFSWCDLSQSLLLHSDCASAPALMVRFPGSPGRIGPLAVQPLSSRASSCEGQRQVLLKAARRSLRARPYRCIAGDYAHNTAPPFTPHQICHLRPARNHSLQSPPPCQHSGEWNVRSLKLNVEYKWINPLHLRPHSRLACPQSFSSAQYLPSVVLIVAEHLEPCSAVKQVTCRRCTVPTA